MKTILIVTSSFFVFLAPVHSQEVRTWTYAKTGSTCKGVIQWKSQDGTELQIKRTDDGRVITVKSEMLTDEDQRQIKAWAPPAPNVPGAASPEVTLGATPPVGSRQAAILGKLQAMVIPSLHFENTTVHESIDYLRLRCSELDESEKIKSQKGLNFVITLPPRSKLPLVTFQAKNIPAGTALEKIADVVGMKIRIKEFFVELAPDGAEEAPELTEAMSEVAGAAAKIIIPRVDFEDTTLVEAVSFFNARIKDLAPGGNMPVIVLDAAADDGSRIREFRVRNVSLLALVSYVVSSTNHQVISKGNNLHITKR